MKQFIKIPVIFHWGFLIWLILLFAPNLWAERGDSWLAWSYYQGMILFIPITSIVIHELGHVLAGMKYGYSILGVHFLWFNAYCAMEIDEDQHDLRNDIIISFAGPLANLLLAGLCWVLIGFFSENMQFFAKFGMLYNILMFILNIVPVPGTDGHAILRQMVLLKYQNPKHVDDGFHKDVQLIKAMNWMERFVRSIQLISWICVIYFLYLLINMVLA